MRWLAGICAALLLVSACTRSEGEQPAGFRVLHKGRVIGYRLAITQKRTASGLGPRKSLASNAVVDVEEEATGKQTYAIVVRAARAEGEESQRVAASRLVGRRIDVDLRNREVVANATAFSGSQDVAANDIAMLFVLFAPLLPSAKAKPGARWRVDSRPAQLPWAVGGVQFTLDNEVTRRAEVHGLHADVVQSAALANLTFRLPLVVPAPPTPGRKGSQTLIVNQLFEALFSDIHNPVQGVAAAIASIPLAVLAPFIALGQAIANLFGSSSRSSSQPSVPAVNLAGPVRLVSSTALWTGDGRVLEGAGTGSMSLSGQIPQLGGGAARLSGTTLHLDTSWAYSRQHTSPFPKPAPRRAVWPKAVAAGLVAIAAALLLAEARRRRSSGRDRSGEGVRDLVGPSVDRG